MARTRFVPFDRDAEDRKGEAAAERRALRKEGSDEVDDTIEHFEGKDPHYPEYDSIEDFVEFMLDNEETEYSFGDLNCLGARTGLRSQQIREALAEWGMTLRRRAPERAFRGFSANPHDRWYGKGSCPTHGGSGGGCIMGLADAG
jgi:hypothetical protein